MKLNFLLWIYIDFRIICLQIFFTFFLPSIIFIYYLNSFLCLDYFNLIGDFPTLSNLVLIIFFICIILLGLVELNDCSRMILHFFHFLNLWRHFKEICWKWMLILFYFIFSRLFLLSCRIHSQASSLFTTILFFNTFLNLSLSWFFKIILMLKLLYNFFIFLYFAFV